MKFFFAYVILITVFIKVNAISEIKDKRIYDNFYNSCMDEKSPEYTYAEMSTYCSCAGNEMMKQFDVKELMLLEGKIMAADESDQMKIAAANKKFMNVVSFCISKIIQ